MAYAGGVTLTFATMFLLGFLATRAEPALNVLGATVEKLSRGAFPKHLLIYAVSTGVASGFLLGTSKILFGVPIIFCIIFGSGYSPVPSPKH